jgi:hypothetical protein
MVIGSYIVCCSISRFQEDLRRLLQNAAELVNADKTQPVSRDNQADSVFHSSGNQGIAD